MNSEDEWYRIGNIHEVDSPALVIYPKRVRQNIELLKAMIGEAERLRPHIKTHKTREAALMMMEAGINRFKCATIAEAEMLGSINVPDVLLAYQPVGPKADRFISIIEKYPATRFSCLVDSIRVARDLSQKASGKVTIPVFIDLNIGMNRTGIQPGSQAIELYRHCSELPGLVPVGLHAYDGHIHDQDLQVRQQRCDEAFAAVETMKEELIKKGFPEPLIVVGGSPTFPIHGRREKVECSPGTFIYWDSSYLNGLPEQSFLPAALVISRIISLPNETTICTDLGHKSIAAENPLNQRVTFLNAPGLEPIGQSEEHLMLRAEKGHSYQVGDVLYGLPYHICPTCALYERAFLVEEGKLEGEWKIVARDRKIFS